MRARKRLSQTPHLKHGCRLPWHVFPAIVRETPFLLAAPVLAVIILTVFWLSRVLFTGWHRKTWP